MRKLFIFIFATVVFILAYHPASNAEQIIKQEGDAFNISDEASGVYAEITSQSLDNEAFEILRDHYNDSTLSNAELFTRFTELKKSYVTAMESLYKTNYLNSDINSPETAMRIYYEGRDELFGLDSCSVYLYNIARYKGLDNDEQVHLDLIVPVQSTYTVITIKFTIPRGKLGTEATSSIAAILSDIKFDGLSSQTEAPKVLNDNNIMETAQLGIYPAASQEQPEYKLFDDTAAGYSLSLPTTYVPFIQNNLGGVITYTSFKINPNQIFSISSEPLQDSNASDAISRFKAASSDSIKIQDSGTGYLGSNLYTFISYTGIENESAQYFYDYYIQGESRLYRLQLQCALAVPCNNVFLQLNQILESFYTEKATSMPDTEKTALITDTEKPASVPAVSQSTPSGITAATKYMNSDEGYSFTYPENWRLEDVSPDIAFDRLRLVVPGLSGALEISVQESELKQAAALSDVMNSINSTSTSGLSATITGYNPPYAGKTSKLLYSDFYNNGAVSATADGAVATTGDGAVATAGDGAVSTIYRLIAFVDENGRNRLCYSIDILKGQKLYSMLITAGEYNTADGRFNNSQINKMINTAAASFRLETTPESEARRISGESRNRKLVFAEKYLKQLIDPALIITSVEKTQPDNTLFVTIGNSSEDGYYKIKLDYPEKKIELVNRVLKRDILQSELASLEEQYKDRIVTKEVQDEDNMTITIESSENLLSVKVARSYRVNVSLENGDIHWQTLRLASQEDYMRECGLYFNSLFLRNTSVYFSDNSVFKSLEFYRQNELKYNFMIYIHTDMLSGFVILYIDPCSTLFTANNINSLEDVEGTIMALYGPERPIDSTITYNFDPETFIMSPIISDIKGNNTLMGQFKIYYNPENKQLEYKKIQ